VNSSAGPPNRLLPSGTSILDLGCGTGIPTAKILSETDHRVVGVDISGRRNGGVHPTRRPTGEPDLRTGPAPRLTVAASNR
jgi:SAM-dependent methyltransferase